MLSHVFGHGPSYNPFFVNGRYDPYAPTPGYDPLRPFRGS